MSTRGITDFVALSATVFTIFLFFTGISVCNSIIKKGSSTNVSFFPFVAFFCSAVCWLKYGLLKQDATLVIVNAVGAITQFIFMIVYYSYTFQKTVIHRQIFFGFLLVIPILSYTKFYTESLPDALFHLGLCCCTMSVMAYGSPLSAIADVFRTKSTETMTFTLCFANFIAAVLWLSYGYLQKDKFIIIPNGIGAILGVIQVSLFCIFPHKKTLKPHLASPSIL